MCSFSYDFTPKDSENTESQKSDISTKEEANTTDEEKVVVASPNKDRAIVVIPNQKTDKTANPVPVETIRKTLGSQIVEED